MTEEDTFRKLRKPDHAHMRKLWVDSELYRYQCMCNPNDDSRGDEVEKFFEEYGWTVKEYSSSYRSRE